MKVFERIFLYSVIALLVFYVFLVDDNVESKEVIQEEIKARRIIIVNDEGQKVVVLCADSRTEGGGRMDIFSGDGTSGAFISASKKGGGIAINNKYGDLAIIMHTNNEDKGVIGVCDRDGKVVGTLP